jgi:hypothetical protein
MMNWRKSSRSNSQGQCVETASWRKSSRSINGGECVETAQGQGVIGVRDSTQPEGPVLEFGTDTWTKFIAQLA